MKGAEIKIFIGDLQPIKKLIDVLSENYNDLPDAVKHYLDEIPKEADDLTSDKTINDFNDRHPELEPGIKFISNTEQRDLDILFPNTKNPFFGQKAYNTRGEDITHRGFRPVFAFIDDQK